MPEITIAVLGPEHEAELLRVTERDSGEVPSGTVLGARLDGRLVAARSLTTGVAVADPFTRTAELQALLAERVRQLRGPGLRQRLLRGYSGSFSRVAA